MYFWSLAWRTLNITLLVCEMNAILWLFEHSLALPFFKTGVKTDLIQSRGHFWVYQIFWHFECSNLIAFTSQDHLNSEVYAVQAIKLTLLCSKMTQPMASLLFLSLFYFFFRQNMSFLKKMSSLKFFWFDPVLSLLWLHCLTLLLKLFISLYSLFSGFKHSQAILILGAGRGGSNETKKCFCVFTSILNLLP